MPTAVPTTWGAVRRNPKRIPEPSSSALFGPGVIEPTSAKAASASSWLTARAVSSVRPWSQWTTSTRSRSCTILACRCRLGGRPDRSGSGRGSRWSRASARSSTPASSTTPTRRTSTTAGRCSSSTTAGSATTSRPATGARAGRGSPSCPPNVVHDGRAALAAGFRKRVLYLTTDVLDGRLTGRAVDRPDTADPALRHALHALHRSLRHPDDALEAESHLATVGGRLRAHLSDPSPSDARPPRLAGELRDLLDGRLFEHLTLARAGGDLGASPAHLIRSFTGTFGIAPHQYVLARRIDAARHRLLAGEPIALVAASVGFFDQAHFTRQFKRHVGIPPGHYTHSAGR
jgi:AraC-like DNA-binding protein